MKSSHETKRAKRVARILSNVGSRDRGRAKQFEAAIGFYDREIEWLKWLSQEIAEGRGPKPDVLQ